MYQNSFLFFSLITVLIIFTSCDETADLNSTPLINWENRLATNQLNDSLTSGSTYLSIYSHIYGVNESRSHDLTVTISMRNIDKVDTIYINKAEYYHTTGSLIRTYINQPIFIAPMETLEIVINQTDKEGGSGANLLFDWSTKPNVKEPYFEAVMISTTGSQGLSFVTQGRRID